jgi:DNA-binding MarR family transcriptional regulator
MKTAKQDTTNHILQIAEEIYKMIGPAVPEEWLSSDLTVTQLRLLLLLHTFGPSRMSDIAANLGVTLPTTTTIVDNLVRKSLIMRHTSPEDRRVVICNLSSDGYKLINALWVSGRLVMEKLLENLTPEQLQKAAEVAEMLQQSAKKLRI